MMGSCWNRCSLTSLVVIRQFVTPTELKEVIHRGGRTWIIFTPCGSVNKVNSPEVIEYLDKHTKVVVESYYVKVLLIEGANEPPSVAKSAESYNAE